MSPALLFTPDVILDAIREWNRKYGEPPSAMDWNVAMARANGHPEIADRFYDDACWPHTGTVLYRFGSWNDAIRAAGFTPRKPGERREESIEATRRIGTHCRRGHEMTPENTYGFADGRRVCRACAQRRNREAYQRRKARAKASA